jgi:methionyl-tRNA formyltransferase
MRVVFMGTPEFAVVSLNKLLSVGINIVAVVTVPDKPSGRGLKMQQSPVKRAAQANHLPILQPENLNDPDFIINLSHFKPDLIVVVAFRILPESVFTLPPLGAINLHGSLLPQYRGAAPINWAIISGEKKTGITTFFIKKEVDTGNIIAVDKIAIGPDMTAGELHDIMAQRGADLLHKTLKKINQGAVHTKKQDNSLVSRAPKINREDCLINFDRPVQNVHDFIRGLSPYPSAYTFLNGKRVKLFRSRIWDRDTLQVRPATVINIPESKSILIQCNPGIIAISEIQIEGKKRLPVEDFLKGNRISAGIAFGEREN